MVVDDVAASKRNGVGEGKKGKLSKKRKTFFRGTFSKNVE